MTSGHICCLKMVNNRIYSNLSKPFDASSVTASDTDTDTASDTGISFSDEPRNLSVIFDSFMNLEPVANYIHVPPPPPPHHVHTPYDARVIRINTEFN